MPFSMVDVVNDPDFAQAFDITRSQGGSFVAGAWQNAVVSIPGYGVVQPSTPEELEQVPEGDRVKGMVTFHSSQVIYETNRVGIGNVDEGTSDTILWNNQTYRIVKVFPWQDFGYYKAMGARTSGQ